MPSAVPPPESAPLPAEVSRVLAFWLEDAVQLGWPSRDLKDLWFGGGAELDQTINREFGELVRQALDGGLAPWEDQPLTRLALTIVLDQFTRNVFRGQGRAFAGDARAQSLVLDGIARGWDRQLPLAGAVFFYMPLMHAEDLALQETCIRCFRALHAGAPPERQKGLQGNVDFAIRHRDIIARFGRFPYRNAALDRTSTAQEQAFLHDGPRFGQ